MTVTLPIDVSRAVSRMLAVMECELLRDECLAFAAWQEAFGRPPEGQPLRLLLEAGYWQRQAERLREAA